MNKNISEAGKNVMVSVGMPLASPASEHPTRRKVFQMGAALAATATATSDPSPAMAALLKGSLKAWEPVNLPDADAAHWLALFQRQREASEANWKTSEALEEAECAARAQYPEQNFTSYHLSYGAGRGKALGWHWFKAFHPFGIHSQHGRRLERGDVIEWYDKRAHSKVMTPELLAEGQIHKQASLADFDAWQNERDAIDARHNIPSLRKVAEEAMERWLAAERAIVETPAVSIAGVAVKLAFWASTGDGQLAYDNPEDASGDDLAALSAWRAAVKLAGLPDEFGMEEHKAWLAERAAKMGSDSAGPSG